MVGTASRILNIVSSGASEGELYLTFSMEWDHKEIEAGSQAAIAQQKYYQAGNPKGVAMTLDKIRELLKDGKL